MRTTTSKSVSPNPTLPLRRIFRPTTIRRRVTRLAQTVVAIAAGRISAVAATGVVIVAVTAAVVAATAAVADAIAAGARRARE